MTTSLTQQLEALLFAAGRPLTVAELSRLTGAEKDPVREALTALTQQYKTGTGALRLLRAGQQVELVTAPDVAPVVQKLFAEEFTGKLSRAALETLAIIAYRGPIAKPAIDHIRGVNSAIMLRTLLVRGLVDRRVNPKDQRTHLYVLTTDFLRFLGITEVEKLPEYQTLSTSAAVEQFLAAQKAREQVVASSDDGIPTPPTLPAAPPAAPPSA